MFTSLFFPQAALAAQHDFNELQRTACSAEVAAQFAAAAFDFDVSDQLPSIRCPTLVLHARSDAFVPFNAEALMMAASIADARLRPLDSDAHWPAPDEPAFVEALTAIEAFLPHAAAAPESMALKHLTRREREIMALIAQGLSNAAIAVRLALSEKTVRNHITNIFDKLEVQSRAQALLVAMRAGLGATASASAGGTSTPDPLQRPRLVPNSIGTMAS